VLRTHAPQQMAPYLITKRGKSGPRVKRAGIDFDARAPILRSLRQRGQSAAARLLRDRAPGLLLL